MTVTTNTTVEPIASRRRAPNLGGWSWSAAFFIAPAVFLLAVFLLYPTISTIILSFENGIDNYVRLFTRDPNFLSFRNFPPTGAFWNNILWVVFYTGGCVLLGLVVAVMASRVRYESIVNGIVFLPQAIAATALGVIWRFVYFPSEQTGLLNAGLGVFGVDPISWLGSTSWVNFSLIVAGIWGSVGFATVILSAALKSISTEILEAARVDGARESQIFWRILVPMLSLPISVVAVTLIINVVKLFDLIFVMTEGGPANASRTIAFTMYNEALAARNFDYGAAIAVVMLVVLLPVMAFNVSRFRADRVIQ